MKLSTSPSWTVRLTPFRIGCLDSAITAERSLTSSRSFGGPPLSAAEDDGVSTATVALGAN